MSDFMKGASVAALYSRMSEGVFQSKGAFAASRWRDQLLERAEGHGGAITVVTAFLLVTGALIVAGKGVPYVMDNNETFSSLNHARNLWNFDFSTSAGLTDEALSPDPSAHPVAHTHQGNFPRLFAFLIYVLGARSAESQIVITSLTIGTASILFGYFFLRRVAGDLFASIAMLLLITDYLMFAQWQVNTYRVWHGFFFFGAFLSVHAFAEWRRRTWVAATMFLYAGLFYGELVFAFFTSVAAGLYALWLYRRNWPSVVSIATVQAGGATLAIVALASQLILYFGWKDFTTDIYLTLLARNSAPDGASFMAQLNEFYDGRNIVFFYNIQSATERGGPLAFFMPIFSIFRNVLQVATPWLSGVALALAAAAFVSDSKLPGPHDVASLKQPAGLASMIALLSMGLFFVLIALADDGSAVMGADWSGVSGSIADDLAVAALCMMIAVIAAIGLVRLTSRVSPSGAPPRLGRSIRASGFLFCLGIFMLAPTHLYDRMTSEAWVQLLSPASLLLAKVLMFVAAALGCLIILAGKRAMFGRWQNVPTGVAPFLVCSGLAFAAAYFLSGGYVRSGYLNRLCPLPIFATQTLVALGWFALIAVVLSMRSRVTNGGMARAVDSTARNQVAAVAACLLLAMTASWIWIQLSYFRTAPPDQLAFITKLRDPAVRGQGLITNTYAVPFGLAADTWGYGFLDHLLEPNELTQFPYLWLADRRTNQKYLRPDLYICFIARYSLKRVTPGLGETEQERCASDNIVRKVVAPGGPGGAVNGELLARDAIADQWAIVRLKWPASDAKTK